MQKTVENYFKIAAQVALDTVVSEGDGGEMCLGDGFSHFLDAASTAHEAGNTLRFVGNGGSAGIASHMAVDFAKRAGIRANAFNDAPMLTCLGNDLGYEQVFAHQVQLHTRPGDMLVAISSSGQSENILNACSAAKANGGQVVTFSGFETDNPLRGMGDLNFYVGSFEYGFVELTHMGLLGAAVDIFIGRPIERHA